MRVRASNFLALAGLHLRGFRGTRRMGGDSSLYSPLGRGVSEGEG